MDTLVLDPYVSERLLRERRERGIDVYDEVWQGLYIMAPAPNDEHQGIGLHLALPLLEVVEDTDLGVVRQSVNLATDPDDWENDYRIPDIVVFLNGSEAVCRGAFWSGPPDFLVEVTSPRDKTREKLSFYSQLGTRELLLVDRDPWQLELYRLQDGHLALSATCTPGDGESTESKVLPLQFSLLKGERRPTIEVKAVNSKRTWAV
ncbi:MAG: Uma2 family endonuclease [Pirellulales bacterium]